MNLTRIAALPGSGGGVVSQLQLEPEAQAEQRAKNVFQTMCDELVLGPIVDTVADTKLDEAHIKPDGGGHPFIDDPVPGSLTLALEYEEHLRKQMKDVFQQRLSQILTGPFAGLGGLRSELQTAIVKSYAPGSEVPRDQGLDHVNDALSMKLLTTVPRGPVVTADSLPQLQAAIAKNQAARKDSFAHPPRHFGLGHRMEPHDLQAWLDVNFTTLQGPPRAYYGWDPKTGGIAEGDEPVRRVYEVLGYGSGAATETERRQRATGALFVALRELLYQHRAHRVEPVLVLRHGLEVSGDEDYTRVSIRLDFPNLESVVSLALVHEGCPPPDADTAYAWS